MNIVIDRFPGIAPAVRSAARGQVTPATTATDVDLTGGTLRGAAANTQTATGHSGPRFVKYLGSWISGLTSPVQWMYEDDEVLIYKESGTWKKKVGGTTATLGLPRPSSPTVDDISIEKPSVSASNLDEETGHPSGLYLDYARYTYRISFSRIIGGVEVEGPLSDVLAASQYYAPVEVVSTHPNATYDTESEKYYDISAATLRYHVIDRPTIPSGVTHWNVYRSDDGDTYKLLMQASASGAGEGFDLVTDTYPSEARTRLFTGRPEDGELYNWSYVITWERTVGAMIDESGPSDPVTLTTNTQGATITRPTSYPSGVTHWNIYRISNGYEPTTDYQLVARVTIGNTYYDDTKDSEDLGDSIPTSYTTSSGEQIVFEELPVGFDGITGQHNGMFFGWKDATLYGSEPGLPDVWPVYYRWTLPAPILAALSTGSELLILTTEGVHRGIGTEPSGFFTTASLINRGITAADAWVSCEHGVFFLSRAGIVQVSGGVGRVISEPTLGAEFFDDYTLTSAFMAYHEGVLYTFFSGGTLVHCLATGSWSVQSAIYSAAYEDAATGTMQVLTSGGVIEELGGSADRMSYTYETGDLVLGWPDIKSVNEVEVYGTGEVTVTVLVDGTQKAAKALNLGGSMRQRTIRLKANSWGRAARVRVQGTGEVKEIRLDIERAS